MRLLLGGQTLLGSPQQREQVERPFCQPEYKCLAMGDEKKKMKKKMKKKLVLLSKTQTQWLLLRSTSAGDVS